MAPARWVIAREDDEEEASSEEEELEDEEVEEASADEAEAEAEEGAGGGDGGSSAAAPSPGSTIKQRKLNIKLGGADVCHVCGKRGHMAGFVGAKYIDCPNKPCYLCGKQGHSTMTCPFRIAPGHGCTVAAGISSDTVLCSLRKREHGGRQPAPQAPATKRWQVDAAVLKLHSRRTTCLEFHPTLDHLVLSGDKKGQIAVWDWQKVYERTVYSSINYWLTNQLRFMPGGDGSSCASSSYDGTVKLFDIETGSHTTVHDANPQGWEAVVEAEQAGQWVTFMGLDVIQSAGTIVAGDNFGRVHFLDHRMAAPIACVPLHRKNGKVQSVHCNPVDANLVMTAGNDYTARVVDIRNLMGGASAGSKGKAAVGAPGALPAELAVLQHTKVINAAYFSPLTGRKILTTAQDNRLRVWDYLYSTNQPADREIVHSQNFNRYLTPFRAEWDPKDPSERLIVCGRYISEDFGGLALHPVDLIDAATGALVGELTDPNLSTICPVNKPHPRQEVIVSGSSRSLYAWRPAPDEEEEEEDAEGERSGQQRRGGGGGGGLPFNLKGSANFVFFDADPDADKKKGKGRGKAAASTATATAGASPSGATTAGASEDRSPGPSASKPAAAKGRGKGKGKAAAALEEDEGEDEEGPGPSKGRKRGSGGSGKGASVGSKGSGGGNGKRQRKQPEAEEEEDEEDDNVYSP